MEEFRCPNCNGIIEFDAESQNMKCPYCDTEFDPETLREYTAIVSEDTEDKMEWEHPDKTWSESGDESVVRFICSSCGGEIIADSTLAATSCPYCDNNTVFTDRLDGDLKPDLVIPFKHDKASAENLLMKYFKSKKLLPNEFSTTAHIQETKGVYVPFWLYDGVANGSFRYRATRSFSRRSGDYVYTETSHFSLIRNGSLQFLNVPVDGSGKMDDTLMESLEPFDLSQAVDFNTAYLAGFFADRYDVDDSTCADRANSRVRCATENAFNASAFGYDTLITEHSSISLNSAKAKYALLPVWLLFTDYKGKRYTFAMNGQTGKMVGDLPIDKGKYFRELLLTLGITAAAVFLLGLLLWLL